MNEDGAAGQVVVACVDDDDVVDVVDNLGGNREVRGGMVSEGEVSCYCSYFC